MDAPSFLPVRLEREAPFRSQLGCTAVIALVLLAVSALAYVSGKEPGDNNWVAYAVSAVFGLVGLLLAWSFIRQLAASRMPETVVEISADPLQPGEPSRICLIQRGPARLKSLRANLRCLERRTRLVWSNQTKTHQNKVEDRLLHEQNLLDARHLNVAAGDVWHELADFTVPADAHVSETVGELQYLWKIEVWGAGYGLASFMHPYVVDVWKGTRAPEEEEDDVDGEGDGAVS